MQPQYNMYGQPIPPMQQPYPPYNQMVQNENRMQALENRLKEWETKQTNAFIPASSPSYPTQPVPNSSAGTSFISVTSAEEAWNSVPDFTGSKQWYINEQAGEIYCKRFDANIPTTEKQTYKLVNNLGSPAKESTETESLEPLLAKLEEIKNLIENPKRTTKSVKGESAQ